MIHFSFSNSVHRWKKYSATFIRKYKLTVQLHRVWGYLLQRKWFGEKIVFQPANKTGYPMLEQLKQQIRLFSLIFVTAPACLKLKLVMLKNMASLMKRENYLLCWTLPVSVFSFHRMWIKLKPIMLMTCLALLPSSPTSKRPWFALTKHANWCLIDNLGSQAMAMCHPNCSRVSLGNPL